MRFAHRELSQMGRAASLSATEMVLVVFELACGQPGLHLAAIVLGTRSFSVWPALNRVFRCTDGRLGYQAATSGGLPADLEE
jgi:hypothetical protein